MNATQNRPETEQRNGQQSLIVQIHHIRQLLTSGAGLEVALTELEKFVPIISAYVASESLANQNLNATERNLAEQRVSEIRSKVRELNALLDSGARLMEEGLEAEGVPLRSAALAAYLLPTLSDTVDALELRHDSLVTVPEA